MKKIFRIRCLEDDRTFSIGANTAYEALCNMMYTLNLNRFDRNCKILKTNSKRVLYIEHTGKTYAVVNNERGKNGRAYILSYFKCFIYSRGFKNF